MNLLLFEFNYKLFELIATLLLYRVVLLSNQEQQNEARMMVCSSMSQNRAGDKFFFNLQIPFY